MKKISIILIFLCLTSQYNFASEGEKIVKSAITEVTVFLSGAQITRSGNLSIPAGTTIMIFDGLPQNIDQQSIQATGKGNFTILSVLHQVNYLKTEEKSKEIIAMEDSVERMQNQLTSQYNMLEVYSSEEKMLLSNAEIGGQDAGVKIADTIRREISCS
ncbi:MAG: DUF4140 domain-containing protein [Bacteroidia bacterium]|nr:DUF4140 domain-containing protein [Bacteroidia bacterium]